MILHFLYITCRKNSLFRKSQLIYIISRAPRIITPVCSFFYDIVLVIMIM